MTFLPMSIAKSPRMVPGADSKGVCGSNDLPTSHNHTLSFPHHYHNRARNNVLNKVMSFKPFREKSFFSNLPTNDFTNQAALDTRHSEKTTDWPWLRETRVRDGGAEPVGAQGSQQRGVVAARDEVKCRCLADIEVHRPPLAMEHPAGLVRP
nr:hypothetical protein Iba_chr12cCG15100 [Ipomoea batatas]